MLNRWTLMGVLTLVVLVGDLPAGEAKDVDVATQLEAFSKAWPSDRTDYRIDGDDSWKAYARTLRAVVDAGDVSALKTGLVHENRQVRALSARALGFLADADCTEALAKALVEDEWPTVRLLAADSLGALGSAAAKEALGAAKGVEQNRDVLLHIGIALGREEGAGKAPKEALLELEEADLGAVTVGKPAPAFRLEGPAGKTFSLADYRGKQPVVMVFIYGDG